MHQIITQKIYHHTKAKNNIRRKMETKNKKGYKTIIENGATRMVLRFRVIVALGKREGGVAKRFKVMVTKTEKEGNGSKSKRKGGVTKRMMTTKLRKKGGNGRTRREGGAMVEQNKRGAMAQLGTPGTKTMNKK